MNGTWKIGAAGAGAAASLLAGLLSLGGDHDAGGAFTRPAGKPSARHHDLVTVHRADSELRADRRRPGGGGDAAVTPGREVAAVPSGGAASAVPVATGVGAMRAQAGDPGSLTLTIPHRVTIVLPRYEGGRPPEATPPSYTPGTAPSVGRRDRQVIVDLGEPGTFTPPSADPGESGTFTPPEIIVE
jgi:hypothetical protein